MIRAMLRMIETHTGLCSGENTMDATILARIRVKTFVRSKGFRLMNRLMDRLAEVTCAAFMGRSVMERAESPQRFP